jgi:hypothetical protein
MRSVFVSLLLILATCAFAQDATRPSDGYTIHVVAPHLVDGKQMGPYHHCCKVITQDPIIVCQIYETTDANAPMVQVEYIIGKKLTRNGKVSLKDWNKFWHDHRVEIAGGRVNVLDLPPDKAKEVADLVATTDGIIFDLWPHGAGMPDGSVRHPQAVGHKNIKNLQAGAQ